jgi:hypothetical protein
LAIKKEDAFPLGCKFFPRDTFCPARTGVGKLFLLLAVFILAAFDLRYASVPQRVKGARQREASA